MKKYIIAAALMLIIGVLYLLTKNPSYSQLQEGDIVFQTTWAGQSPIIIKATHSLDSHCGIIVKNSTGHLVVLEAMGTVRLTPLAKWRSQGVLGRFRAYRVFDKPVKVEYSEYLGKKYDYGFNFNDDKWYCSELVYDIYLKQFNTRLCIPRKLKDYSISGFESVMQERGMSIEQFCVAPSDISESTLLQKIK